MKLLFAAVLFPFLLFPQTRLDYNTQLKNQPDVLSDKNTAYTTFAQACAAAGSTKTLILSKAWTSVPTQTCAASIQKVTGGTIQPASGQLVTLSGNITAPPGQQIFDYSAGGTVLLTNTPTVQASWFSGGDVGAQVGNATGSFGLGCGTVTLPASSGSVWSTLASFTPTCISVIGQGNQASSFSCTANGDCIRLNQASPYQGRQQGTLQGFSLIGTGTANGVGIHMNSAIGEGITDVYLSGFTGVNGAGIWMENGATSKFSERNTFIRLNIENCTKLIRMSVSATAETSFGYNRFLDLKLNLYAGQYAFSVENTALWYNAYISAIVNGNAGTSSIFHVQDTATLSGNIYQVQAENTTGVALNAFDVASGLTVEGTGWVKCDGCVNSTAGAFIWPTISQFTCGPSSSRFDNGCPSYTTQPFGAAKNVAGDGYGKQGAYLIPETGNPNFLFGVGLNGRFDGTNWRCFGEGTNNGCAFAMGSSNSGWRFYQIASTGGADQTVAPAAFEGKRVGVLDLTGFTPEVEMFAKQGISVSTGIANSATGFQHGRFFGCTTGASAGDACTATVTWVTPFADANYTVSCVGDGIALGVPRPGGITAKVAASVGFITVAGTATAAGYTLLDCMAVHDKN